MPELGDWIFDPSQGDSPASMEMRRKIALQIMANDSKKGYPKNLGEGLASLGSSLGDIGYMMALNRREKAYRTQQEADIKQQEQADTAPSTPTTTSPRADAGDTPPSFQTASLEPSDTNVEPPPAPAPLPPPPPPPSVVAPPPTASQPPPPAPVAAPPIVPQARAPVAASPIVRLNRDGTLAGNLTSPNEPPSPVEQPTRAPVTRSVSAQPFLGGNAPYVVGDPTGDQGAKMQALSQYAQTLPQQAPQQVADDPNRIGTPSGGDAMLAALQQRAAELAAARQEGTPEQGSRLAYSFDRLNPQPAVASLSGVRNLDPMTPKDVTQARVLADVTGMGSDRGYNYPPTASLGREGSVQSDAPQVGITGVSPRVGEAASETTQQMRDAITKQLIERSIPAPEVPQPNPTQAGPTAPATTIQPPTLATGSPPEAANNPPIVSDITPQPAEPVPAPGVRMTQAPRQVPLTLPANMPPQVPPPGTPAIPAPEPQAEPRVETPPALAGSVTRPADPVMPGKTKQQLLNEHILHLYPDDPVRSAAASRIVTDLEKVRQDEYNRRVDKWKDDMRLFNEERTREQEFRRTKPQRELELQKGEDERANRAYTEGITRMLGGISPQAFEGNLNKSKEAVSGVTAAQEGIKRAKTLVDKMYTGPFADTETFLAKVVPSFGFPLDPKASATEQFKTAMTNVMAQNRKAIVGAGAQSEAELALLQKSTAADAKLTPETIKATLEAAERLNLQTVLAHQQLVRRYAGETDPNRQGMVYGNWGVPNATIADMVPQASVNKLFQFYKDPQVHKDFDNTFHTPGLSRDVLLFRRPQ
jgi:hypothetical protein